MGTRVFGPTGSKRRKRFLFVPVLLALCAGLLFAVGAQAVHNDNFFELGPSGAGPTYDATTAANIVGDGNTAPHVPVRDPGDRDT